MKFFNQRKKKETRIKIFSNKIKLAKNWLKRKFFFQICCSAIKILFKLKRATKKLKKENNSMKQYIIS